MPARAAPPVRADRRAGFTLIELILAVGLLVVLAGMGVLAGSGYRDERKFKLAVDRLETALRMARAEAATSARRVRLAFDESTGEPMVLWEPSPLALPGQFQRYSGCNWINQLPRELLRVTACRLIGPDGQPMEADTTTAARDDESEDFRPITFYPGGTSDSAVIEMVSVADPENLRAAIKLDGENQIITTRILYGEADDEEDPFADEETDNSE